MLLLLVPLSLSAAETGYRIVHPDGTVEFTDDPRRGGEPIELKEAPTFKSLPAPAAPAATPAAEPDEEKPQAPQAPQYQSIRITSPKQAQTLWFDGTGINFTVVTQPALRANDEIAIEVDGKEVVKGKQNSFIVHGIFRGEHHVNAKVVDSQGTTLLQSAPVVFYLQRHTINKP